MRFSALATPEGSPAQSPVPEHTQEPVTDTHEDVCYLDKYQASMRKHIIRCIAGEVSNEPVCRCGHVHDNSEIPCRHAGRHDHPREECVFDHSYFGPCPELPLCRHDGFDYHVKDLHKCRFRHMKSVAKLVVATPQKAAPQKFAPPPLDSPAWVLLPQKVPVPSPTPAPAPASAPSTTMSLEITEDEDDAEIARLEAEKVQWMKKNEKRQTIARLKQEVAELKAKVA